jgi:hypothetical protein
VAATTYQVEGEDVVEQFFLVQDPDGYLLRFVQDPDVVSAGSGSD